MASISREEYKMNYYHQVVKGFMRPRRTPRYEYICRRLVSKNKTGDAYGLTIPAKLVMEHGLLGKRFKVEVEKSGRVCIRTVITYREMKGGVKRDE